MIRTIRPGNKIRLSEYILSVYSYRRLIFDFGFISIKSLYAQTSLGLIWVFIQPLLHLVIYSVFFGILLNIQTGNLSFPVYIFSGLILWTLFLNFFNSSYRIIHNQRDMIRKVRFPAIVLLLSRVVSSAIELLVFLTFLGCALLIFDVPLSVNSWLAPIFILLTLLFAIGLSLFFAVISVRFRDTLHIAPFIGGVGMWLTPIFYPITILPENLRIFVYVNPLSGMVEGFRWACFGWETDLKVAVFSGIFILCFFLLSVNMMKRAEKNFSDRL